MSYSSQTLPAKINRSLSGIIQPLSRSSSLRSQRSEKFTNSESNLVRRNSISFSESKQSARPNKTKNTASKPAFLSRERMSFRAKRHTPGNSAGGILKQDQTRVLKDNPNSGDSGSTISRIPKINRTKKDMSTTIMNTDR